MYNVIYINKKVFLFIYYRCFRKLILCKLHPVILKNNNIYE